VDASSDSTDGGCRVGFEPLLKVRTCGASVSTGSSLNHH